MVQTLFALMATLDDTNLLHRGGPAGLTFVQAEAQRFLDRGVCSDQDGALGAGPP